MGIRTGYWFGGVAMVVAIAVFPLVLWGDHRAWLLARNTAALAAGACLVALPLGTLLALLLLRTDIPGRRVYLFVFATLLFVPLYLQAAGWDAGFGRQGWFSLVYGSIAAPILDGWRAAIWIHGLAAVPWVLLITGIGLRLVEPELEEAALLEGSVALVLAKVTLPRTLPFVVVAALWTLVMTGTEMTVTDLYRVRTFAEEIYIDIPFAGVGSMPGGQTLEPLRPTATTNLVFITVLAATALLVTMRLAPPEHLPTVRRRRLFALGRGRWFACGAVGLMALLAAGVPLGNLVYKAGMIVEQVGTERTRHWSFGTFAEVVLTSPSYFLEEHGWTILVAVGATVGALVIGTPLAWLARRGRFAALPALSLSALCLAVPGPMLGLSIIWLLNRESSDFLIWLYDRTIFAPWLAMLVKCLPIVILVSWYALRSVPDELVEDARVEGAGWWTRFWRVGALQRLIALAVAALAALAVAMGDLSASILVVPPGVTTISVRVFGLLHAGADDQVAGIALSTVLIFLLEAALILGLLRWQRVVREKEFGRV